MTITFLAVAARVPFGAAIAIFELANGLVRRGHEVHIVHLEFGGEHVRSLEDVGWFRFEDRIQHHFPETFDEGQLPDADYVVCFDDRIPHTRGLPVNLILGLGAFDDLTEARILSERCPKLCISQYLIEALGRRRVRREQLVHLPLGLDHSVFRVHTPLEQRPRQVSMRFCDHPDKGMRCGVAALDIVKQKLADVSIVLFAGPEDAPRVPADMKVIVSPAQDQLVGEIYNQSRVFVCSSNREGFGLPSAEAMACGCALVTTNNGGSREFAIHGETALVSEPTDADALAANVLSLLLHDDERLRLARAGIQCVERLDWDVSARVLEEFLASYGSDPERYQASDLPRPRATPEFLQLFEERSKLTRMRMIGKVSEQQYTLEYAELTNRINAVLSATEDTAES